MLTGKTMNTEIAEEDKTDEHPDSWWYRIYIAVMVFTVFIIAAFGAFSRYFSS